MGRVAAAPLLIETPVVKAFFGILMLGALHFLNSHLGSRSPFLDRLAGGHPRVLVRNGRIDRRALARERLGDQELQSALRGEHVDDLRDVLLAVLEPDGRISVIRTPEARPLERRDLALMSRRMMVGERA